MKNPTLRVISAIITFAFIFTQCGLGMAVPAMNLSEANGSGPVYNKVGQNLRTETMAEAGGLAGAMTREIKNKDNGGMVYIASAVGVAAGTGTPALPPAQRGAEAAIVRNLSKFKVSTVNELEIRKLQVELKSLEGERGPASFRANIKGGGREMEAQARQARTDLKKIDKKIKELKEKIADLSKASPSELTLTARESLPAQPAIGPVIFGGPIVLIDPAANGERLYATDQTDAKIVYQGPTQIAEGGYTVILELNIEAGTYLKSFIRENTGTARSNLKFPILPNEMDIRAGYITVVLVPDYENMAGLSVAGRSLIDSPGMTVTATFPASKLIGPDGMLSLPLELVPDSSKVAEHYEFGGDLYKEGTGKLMLLYTPKKHSSGKTVLNILAALAATGLAVLYTVSRRRKDGEIILNKKITDAGATGAEVKVAMQALCKSLSEEAWQFVRNLHSTERPIENYAATCRNRSQQIIGQYKTKYPQASVFISRLEVRVIGLMNAAAISSRDDARSKGRTLANELSNWPIPGFENADAGADARGAAGVTLTEGQKERLIHILDFVRPIGEKSPLRPTMQTKFDAESNLWRTSDILDQALTEDREITLQQLDDLIGALRTIKQVYSPLREGMGDIRVSDVDLDMNINRLAALRQELAAAQPAPSKPASAVGADKEDAPNDMTRMQGFVVKKGVAKVVDEKGTGILTVEEFTDAAESSIGGSVVATQPVGVRRGQAFLGEDYATNQLKAFARGFQGDDAGAAGALTDEQKKRLEPVLQFALKYLGIINRSQSMQVNISVIKGVLKTSDAALVLACLRDLETALTDAQKKHKYGVYLTANKVNEGIVSAFYNSRTTLSELQHEIADAHNVTALGRLEKIKSQLTPFLGHDSKTKGEMVLVYLGLIEGLWDVKVIPIGSTVVIKDSERVYPSALAVVKLPSDNIERHYPVAFITGTEQEAWDYIRQQEAAAQPAGETGAVARADGGVVTAEELGFRRTLERGGPIALDNAGKSDAMARRMKLLEREAEAERSMGPDLRWKDWGKSAGAAGVLTEEQRAVAEAVVKDIERMRDTGGLLNANYAELKAGMQLSLQILKEQLGSDSADISKIMRGLFLASNALSNYLEDYPEDPNSTTMVNLKDRIVQLYGELQAAAPLAAEVGNGPLGTSQPAGDAGAAGFTVIDGNTEIEVGGTIMKADGEPSYIVISVNSISGDIMASSGAEHIGIEPLFSSRENLHNWLYRSSDLTLSLQERALAETKARLAAVVQPAAAQPASNGARSAQILANAWEARENRRAAGIIPTGEPVAKVGLTAEQKQRIEAVIEFARSAIRSHSSREPADLRLLIIVGLLENAIQRDDNVVSIYSELGNVKNALSDLQAVHHHPKSDTAIVSRTDEDMNIETNIAEIAALQQELISNLYVTPVDKSLSLDLIAPDIRAYVPPTNFVLSNGGDIFVKKTDPNRFAVITEALRSGEITFQPAGEAGAKEEAMLVEAERASAYLDKGEAAAKVRILAITQNKDLARVQLEEMLKDYQSPTGESVTMDDITFYQLPDKWTNEDIERESRGMQAVLLNVDGLALQADIMSVLKALGIPTAEVRQSNWRDALNSV